MESFYVIAVAVIMEKKINLSLDSRRCCAIFMLLEHHFAQRRKKISLMEDFVNHSHDIQNLPLKYYHKWDDLGILW